MSKKGIAIIVVIVLLVIIGGVAYFMSQNSNESENRGDTQENLMGQTEENNLNENEAQVTEENNSENTENGGKTLVVYFSASGNTEAVAQKIAENLGADIFEITPVDEYTSADLDWTDDNSRVTR